MSHTTEVQLLGTTKSVFDKRKRQGTVTDTTIESEATNPFPEDVAWCLDRDFYGDTFDPSYDRRYSMANEGPEFIAYREAEQGEHQSTERPHYE